MSRARALWERVPTPVVDIALAVAVAVDLRLNLWDATPAGVTLAAVGCAALTLRRRFPLAVVPLTLPITLMQDVALAPLAALFALAERSRNRRLLAVCAACSPSRAASRGPWTAWPRPTGA